MTPDQAGLVIRDATEADGNVGFDLTPQIFVKAITQCRMLAADDPKIAELCLVTVGANSVGLDGWTTQDYLFTKRFGGKVALRRRLTAVGRLLAAAFDTSNPELSSRIAALIGQHVTVAGPPSPSQTLEAKRNRPKSKGDGSRPYVKSPTRRSLTGHTPFGQ